MLTEILISLIVIAVIGGIIGWLVRGAHGNREDNKLDEALEDKAAALEKAREQINRLESSMKKMNQLRSAERESLQGRIHELEPLFDIVEKRDGQVRELTESLKNAEHKHQAELEKFKFSQSTLGLFDDGGSAEIEKLKDEVKLSNRQRDSAISRYQDQVRQIEDLENLLADKDRQLSDLNEKIANGELGGQKDFESMKVQLARLQDEIKDKDEQLSILENKHRYQLDMAEARAAKAESDVAAQEEERLTRDAELVNRIEQLDTAIRERDETLNELRQRLESSSAMQPPAIPAVTPVHPPANRANRANRDSLQALKGIGPSTEERLNQLGIHTLEQIATLNDADIERIGEKMPTFTTHLKRYNWIDNARELTRIGAETAAEVVEHIEAGDS
ncbi:MAG: hypothetical protein DHS20C01_22960 [marine bacterium B5-7]|nr:MAG: hypothetical protein DHS20C01_22960 [marine bacterium B5-7]